MNSLYKIDKTLIDNMNLNRSCIVITPKETARADISEKVISAEEEEQISPALREKMREFIQSTNEKAQKILRDAEIEADQIREAARCEGYEAGIAEGRQKLDAELKAKNKEVRDVLSRVEKYRQDLYQMLESDVLSLSMDVAEKIVNIAIDRDDNVFKDIVKKAVASIKHADNFSLYVSRAEHDKYFNGDVKWLRDAVGSKKFDVICDANLPQGSCIAEADSEIVDAGIPMQLGKIGQLLREQVE
jgi:flagellar assembly protein FliH